MNSSPATFPKPATLSQIVECPFSPAGTPEITAVGIETISPTTITVASSDQESISLVARAAVSVVMVQATAAPSPPRIANIVAG